MQIFVEIMRHGQLACEFCDYSWIRRKKVRSWVLAFYSTKLTILWDTFDEDGISIVKKSIEDQYDIILKIEKFKHGYGLTINFDNEADEAEFMIKIS